MSQHLRAATAAMLISFALTLFRRADARRDGAAFDFIDAPSVAFTPSIAAAFYFAAIYARERAERLFHADCHAPLGDTSLTGGDFARRVPLASDAPRLPPLIR